MPLYENGAFGPGVALFMALLIGFVFGFFLERGGMGSARKLAAQFYLTDLSVLKIMFTAIVTAMLGSFWLSKIGVLDLSQVYVPATYVLPQAVGGLVFGIGFVTGGLCPGTSCVAAATGRTDGIGVLLGMCAGIFVFGELFVKLQGFYDATPLGEITIAELFGVPRGVVVFGITMMALGAFILAGRLEPRALERRAAAGRT